MRAERVRLEHVYKLLWNDESAADLARALMELPMMEEQEGMRE